MKLRSALLALAVMVAVGAVAVLGNRQEPADAKMVVAGQKFLAGLDDKQKAKATFAFDSKERTNWFFVPHGRRANKELIRGAFAGGHDRRPEKEAALNCSTTGTSTKGNVPGHDHHEPGSHPGGEQEADKKTTPVRNPEWYFFTVFGTPANKGKWGWRVEGHHLSLNFTLEDGVVVSATPIRLRSEPGPGQDGDPQGERILPRGRGLRARSLQIAWTTTRRKWSQFRKPFGEPRAAEYDRAQVGAARGLAAAKMNEKKRVILLNLVQAVPTACRQTWPSRELKGVVRAIRN